MNCISVLYFVSLGIALNGAQGIPDLSFPSYATEYRGYHINLFKDTSVPAVPAFYYTPACFLLPNATTFTAKNASPRYMTIKIGLWDEQYTQHIRSYLAAAVGTPTPRSRPVPFQWMRIDTIDNRRNSQFLGQWKSIANQPKTVTFRIRCLTSSSCDEMEEALATDSQHFASNIHLAFSYRLPNTTKSTVSIQRDHLLASQTFQAVNARYPEASFVFMPKADFDDFAREVMKQSIMSLFHTDQFVDDEQTDDLLPEYSSKLFHNVTSTAQFTESMWNVTFWTDKSPRPDVNANDLIKGQSGKHILTKPLRLWCVALGVLREKTDFGASSIWVTQRTADYVTAAHWPTTKNSATDSLVGTGTARYAPVPEYHDPYGLDQYAETPSPSVAPFPYYPEQEGHDEATRWGPYGGAIASGVSDSGNSAGAVGGASTPSPYIAPFPYYPEQEDREETITGPPYGGAHGSGVSDTGNSAGAVGGASTSAYAGSADGADYGSRYGTDQGGANVQDVPAFLGGHGPIHHHNRGNGTSGSINTTQPLPPTHLKAENLDGGTEVWLTFISNLDTVAKSYDIYYTDDPALPDDQWRKEMALGEDIQAVIDVGMFQKRRITIKMRTLTLQGTGEFGATIQHHVDDPTAARSPGNASGNDSTQTGSRITDPHGGSESNGTSLGVKS